MDLQTQRSEGEEFETQHSNHTTVWNVGHKAPEKDTINNWKCGDAFWSKNCWYWGILSQVGGCFVEKKVLCLLLLTYLYTVLPHSPFHAGEQKYSHSHDQVNTVAVSSKPLSKCTVWGLPEELWYSTLSTHSHPNTNTTTDDMHLKHNTLLQLSTIDFENALDPDFCNKQKFKLKKVLSYYEWHVLAAMSTNPHRIIFVHKSNRSAHAHHTHTLWIYNSMVKMLWIKIKKDQNTTEADGSKSPLICSIRSHLCHSAINKNTTESAHSIYVHISHIV